MSSPVIQLQLINRSDDENNSDVAVFQRDPAVAVGESALAWLLIRDLSKGARYEFEYPIQAQVGASDAWGNFSPRLDANPGSSFNASMQDSKLVLLPAVTSAGPSIEVLNALQKGAIDVQLFRGGNVAMAANNVVPGEKAVFLVKPVLYFGIISETALSGGSESGVMSAINTEVSLIGIKSADIVLTGGGSGVNAKPYTFTLQNVVSA